MDGSKHSNISRNRTFGVASVAVAIGFAAIAGCGGVRPSPPSPSGTGSDTNPGGGEVLGEVVAISAGDIYGLAITSDGAVWSWGLNSSVEMGGAMPGSGLRAPEKVSSLPNASGISAGTGYAVAVTPEGTVWAWGDNSSGQLGDGTNITRLEPVPIAGFTGSATVDAGVFQTLALRNDGTVWACGMNGSGALGNGTNIDSNIPVQTRPLGNAQSIAQGLWHGMALLSDGTVWAWGYNQNGQLGQGTDASTNDDPHSNVPVEVLDLTFVRAIAAGAHSLALRDDGTVWAWGANWDGQVGNGANENGLGVSVPVRVLNLDNVLAIAAGPWHSLAVRNDGTVWAWGNNSGGQLGDGTDNNRTTPVQVRNISNAVAVAAGSYFSFALKSDGTVWAWGENDFGQLGNGTNTASRTPVKVLFSGGGEQGKCETDGDCNDGDFCNGAESCDLATGECLDGATPCDSATQVCDPAFATCRTICSSDADCGDLVCDPTGNCVVCLANPDCSDDLFCNGVETCDLATGDCASGAAPCASNQTCDEVNDTCPPVGPCYTPGVPILRTLPVELPSGTDAWGVEENVPAGWIVTDASDDGGFVASINQVRWTFFGGDPVTLSYTATPPSDATGNQCFAGVVIAEMDIGGTTNQPTGADTCLDACPGG